MDPKPIADELRAIDGRGPCTDAERRAARAGRLAGGGRAGVGLPGPRVLLVLALAALVAFAAARAGGSGGAVLGAVQLLPTAVCIAGVGAFLDAWVAGPGDAAAGPAAAI